MTEPFTVEAGIRYNIEDGNVSGVMMQRILHEKGNLPIFVDEVSGIMYESNGKKVSMLGTWETGIDLISEYIEPTAEPQDECTDWVLCFKGDDFVPDTKGVETVYRDGVLHKWRIRTKKEPVVTVDEVWIREDGQVFHWLVGTSPSRKAIITLTDGELDIDWAE